MTFFIDPIVELDSIAEASFRELSARARIANLDPAAASARINRYQTMFPWMRPDTISALAVRGGLDPESPAARSAAHASARIAVDIPTNTSIPASRLRATSDFSDLSSIEQNASTMRSIQRGRSVTASSRAARQQTSDPVLQAIRNSTFFDKETQLPIRPDSEKERAVFARELRAISRRYGLKRGVPFFDPDAERVQLLPSRGNPTDASLKGGVPASDMTRILKGGEAQRDFPFEVEFSKLHPAEQLGLLFNEQSAEERQSGPLGFKQLAFDVLRGTIRGGLTILRAPIQEGVGQFRNVVGLARGDAGFEDFTRSQSDLGVLFGTDRDLEDIGTGFLPSEASEIARERLRRERESGLLNDQVITPGRAFASYGLAGLVIEPGSTPYDLLSGAVDFGKEFLDPAAFGLAKLGKVRAARKAFSEVGLLKTVRNTIDPDVARRFADTAQATKIFEKIAKTDNTFDILKGLGPRTDPALAARFADEADPNIIKQIFTDEIGTGITSKPKPSAFSPTIKPHVRQVRLFNRLPEGQMDMIDPRESVIQTERFLRGVKAPDPMVRNFVDKMARTTDKAERLTVLEDMIGGAEGLLVKSFKVHPSRARELIRPFIDNTNFATSHFADEISDLRTTFTRSTVVNGQSVPVPSPHLLLESIDRFAPLPDATALRQATSKFGRLLNNPVVRLPESGANWLMQNIWKPAVLLRGAWPVRALGEEQVRMSAAGLDSMFSLHPQSYIAWMTGKKGAIDALGENFDEGIGFQRLLSRSAGFRTPTSPFAGAGKFDVINQAEDINRFRTAWAKEITQLRSDPVARIVAEQGIDQAKITFRTMPDRKILAKTNQTVLTDRGAERYIETLADRINIKTGGDPDLIASISTGKFNNIPVQKFDSGIPRLNKDFTKALDAKLPIAPATVKAERALGPAALQRADAIVDQLFAASMGIPQNKLNKIPTYIQLYWRKHMPRFVAFGDEQAKVTLIANAKKAGIDGKDLARLEGITPKGNLSLEELDFLAKGHTLDDAKALIFDLANRSQFFEATKLIAPFGDAWREIITSWTKIIAERPQTIRRADQILRGAREQSRAAEILGAPPGDGFFHQNSFGEEVFTFPFSQALTSQFLDVPIPLTGRVQGLNMVGNVFPGLGPLAQIPVSYFLPETPAWDGVREILLPFGEFKNPANLKQWAPAWLQRLSLAGGGDDPETVRLFANAAKDIAVFKSSTGEYKINDPDPDIAKSEVDRLMSDSKKAARWLYVVRAIGAFAAPTPPSPEFLVKDKDGKLLMAEIAANEYRGLLNEDPETASQRFLDIFGENMFLSMQAKTLALVRNSPVSKAGDKFRRNNPDLVKAFPDTYAFFAPVGKDFDFDAYRRSLGLNERVPLTLEQFVKLGNSRVAAMRYGNAVERVDENMKRDDRKSRTDEERFWLRDMRAALIRQYPGYDAALKLPERADVPQLITELKDTIRNPKLAKSPVGRGLAIYLRNRDKAIAEADNRGVLGWQTAAATADLRAFLRDLGDAIASDHPQFFTVWDDVLSREIEEEEEEEE